MRGRRASRYFGVGIGDRIVRATGLRDNHHRNLDNSSRPPFRRRLQVDPETIWGGLFDTSDYDVCGKRTRVFGALEVRWGQPISVWLRREVQHLHHALLVIHDTERHPAVIGSDI